MDLMRQQATAGGWPLYLFGAVGVGKSFVAASVFVRWRGTVSMLRYCDLIANSIHVTKYGELSRYNERDILCEYSEASWWRYLADVGLVIVDEIGSGVPHEWRNELFWKFLELRKGRPLILTTNVDPDAIHEQFDGRIESRILAGSLIEVTGRDQRRDGLKARVHRVSTDPRQRAKT